MNKQINLSAFNDELAQVRTKKKEFLSRIDRIIPWGEWIALIQPSNYKGERGNKPYDLELMLRIYMLQNLYDLSDESTAAEVIDSRAFSDFCGVDSSNQVPNGDTLGRFRNLSGCHCTPKMLLNSRLSIASMIRIRRLCRYPEMLTCLTDCLMVERVYI